MYSVFSLSTAFTNKEIAESSKDALRPRWERVVAPEFLPSQEEDVEWSEAVEYPTATEQRRVGARWATPEGLMIADGRASYDGIKLCLQLSGDDRISFRSKEPREGVVAATRREDILPQDILGKPRLLEILTTYFRFPLETTNDFQVLEGSSGTYEGVRIFSGNIRWSRRGLEERPDRARIGQGSKAFNEANLFITDSEPQYFCIGVTFGKE